MLNLKIGPAQKKPPEETQPQEEQNQQSLINQSTLQMREQQTEAQESAQSAQDSGEVSLPRSTEPDHFDDLVYGDETTPEQAAPQDVANAMLSKDDFHRLFCGGFQAASFVTGLESLVVEQGNGSAQAASGAIYDTILDIPALHFILMPQNKWLDRTMAVAMFVVPMSAAVSRELAAKKSAAQAQAEGQQPEEESADIPDFDMSGKGEKV